MDYSESSGKTLSNYVDMFYGYEQKKREILGMLEKYAKRCFTKIDTYDVVYDGKGGIMFFPRIAFPEDCELVCETDDKKVNSPIEYTFLHHMKSDSSDMVKVIVTLSGIERAELTLDEKSIVLKTFGLKGYLKEEMLGRPHINKFSYLNNMQIKVIMGTKNMINFQYRNTITADDIHAAVKKVRLS